MPDWYLSLQKKVSFEAVIFSRNWRKFCMTLLQIKAIQKLYLWNGINGL